MPGEHEDGHLQVKEKGLKQVLLSQPLEETSTYWQLDFRLPVSRTETINFCCLSIQFAGLCYSSPRKRMQGACCFSCLSSIPPVVLLGNLSSTHLSLGLIQSTAPGVSTINQGVHSDWLVKTGWDFCWNLFQELLYW